MIRLFVTENLKQRSDKIYIIFYAYNIYINMDEKNNMSFSDVRNLVFSRINYNINDPQKKRVAAIVNFINEQVKKYKTGLKLAKKNMNTLPELVRKTPIEQIKYFYALSSYTMLVSLQSAAKKNKLTKEQCDAVTSDINYLIKKYKIDQKKDKMGYNKDGCTKKYKSKQSKQNCTKKMCGG